MDFIVIQGDIADQYADALVSAGSSRLSMGGGAARALLESAGDPLKDAAREQAPVDPGQVAVTDAFDLHAEFVIHAVTLGRGGRSSEEIIRTATTNALQAADDRDCHSLVLPALGAGVGDILTPESARYMAEAIDTFQPEVLADVRIIGHTPRSRWEITEAVDKVRYTISE